MESERPAAVWSQQERVLPLQLQNVGLREMFVTDTHQPTPGKTLIPGWKSALLRFSPSCSILAHSACTRHFVSDGDTASSPRAEGQQGSLQ